jgi:NAD-dependent SIR2 family protein deacetylase
MGFVCKCGNEREFSCIYEHYSETVDGEGNVLEADGNIQSYRCERCGVVIEPEEFQLAAGL